MKHNGKKRTPREERFLQAMEQTLSSDPHLSDVDLIELGAGALSIDDERRLQRHISNCGRCAGELNELEAQISAAWGDPVAVERRETRIGRQRVLSDIEEAPWWAEMLSGWTSLHPFRKALAARAEGGGAESVSFSVLDNGRPAYGVAGFVQRRGSAFYLCVTTTAEARAAGPVGQVEVVAVDREKGIVLFERTVNPDQFTLLGTDLEIGSQQITARVLH